ncbi:MAG: amidohydrolase [Treponemataceae bacterium]|nr:amidohydrolase [Treponemataceae bacterium]
MKIIDFHAHIYPEKIAEKAALNVGKFYDAGMEHPHAISDELIASGSKIGVTNYVVHSVATKAEQVISINNFIIGECSIHPEFIGFATHHPDFEDFENEVDRIMKAGLKGIKMHSDFQKFQVDSPSMDSFYSCLEERQLPILFHAGDCRFDFSGPKRIAHVLDKHPSLKVIAAHFGGYTEWDKSIEFLVGRKVWFDTSSTTWKLPFEKANKMIKEHGAEFFLFGSDFPMWDHKGEWERFQNFDFNPREKEMVLHENAEKLLGLRP